MCIWGGPSSYFYSVSKTGVTAGEALGSLEQTALPQIKHELLTLSETHGNYRAFGVCFKTGVSSL